jgi:hypothetical protein
MCSTRARDYAARTMLALSLVTLACGQVSRNALDDGVAGAATGAGGGAPNAGATATEGGMALSGSGGDGAGMGALAGAGAESGTGASCPAGKDCIAMIPKGWQGPIAAHDTSLGGKAPPCDGDFARQESPMHGDLDGGEHSCSCRCNFPEGLACGEAALQFFENDSCSDAASATTTLWPNGVDSCFGLLKPSPEAYRSVRLGAVAPLDSGSTCAPRSISTIDEASWKETLTACASNAPPRVCGPEVLCVDARPAAAFNLGLCIYQEGDALCPTGYERRMLRYRSFIDERSCSDCTCGTPKGECQPHIELTGDSPLCVKEVTLDAVGECLPFTVAASAQSILYQYVGEPLRDDVCPASKPKAVGRLQAIEPVTVCCDKLE